MNAQLIFAILPNFLQAVAAVLNSPSLAGQKAIPSTLAQTLSFGADLVGAGEAGLSQLDALSEHLQKIVADAAGRGSASWAQVIPDADWAAWDALHAQAKAIIAGTAAPTPEAPTEPPAAPPAPTEPPVLPVGVAVSQNEPDPHAAPNTGAPPPDV